MRKTQINPLSEHQKQQHRAIVKSTYLTFLFIFFSSPTLLFGMVYNIQLFTNSIDIYDSVGVRVYKNSYSVLYLIQATGFTYMASNLPILLLTNKVFFNEAKSAFKEFVNCMVRTRIYDTIIHMTTMIVQVQASQQRHQ
jgi:hypothetical protein